MSRIATLAALAALALAGSASTAVARLSAPEPRRVIDPARMAGVWYEIAHTPNARQNGCQADTLRWTPSGPGRFQVINTCRKGSPAGPASVTRASATITDPVLHAKARLSFLGGMISQEYWLIDRAPDYGWMIMGTPGGNYVWLLSKRPFLAPSERVAALSAVRALGYDAPGLIFPVQPPA